MMIWRCRSVRSQIEPHCIPIYYSTTKKAAFHLIKCVCARRNAPTRARRAFRANRASTRCACACELRCDIHAIAKMPMKYGFLNHSRTSSRRSRVRRRSLRARIFARARAYARCTACKIFLHRTPREALSPERNRSKTSESARNDSRRATSRGSARRFRDACNARARFSARARSHVRARATRRAQRPSLRLSSR